MQDAQIYELSEEIKVELKKKNIVYPFKTLPVGKSFCVDCSEVKEASFRALVSIANSKSENTFKCFKHALKNGSTVLEVANIGNKKLEANNVPYDCNIIESSPEAKKFINFGGDKVIYPFATLPEGCSFTIPIAEAKENSLRSSCTVQSNKLGKKFVVIKHEDPHNCFEIACIPLTKRPKLSITGMSPQAHERAAEFNNERE